MHWCMANQEHIYIDCPWYDRYYDKYGTIALSAFLPVSNQQMPFRWVLMTVFVCVCEIGAGIRSSNYGMWMKFNEFYLSFYAHRFSSSPSLSSFALHLACLLSFSSLPTYKIRQVVIVKYLEYVYGYAERVEDEEEERRSLVSFFFFFDREKHRERERGERERERSKYKIMFRFLSLIFFPSLLFSILSYLAKETTYACAWGLISSSSLGRFRLLTKW